MSDIDLTSNDDAAAQLWTGVRDLVELLPGGWVIVGGLMVQLYTLEHGMADARATVDIDVLAQARPQGALAAIHAALCGSGFELVGPDRDGYAHRYDRAGLVVDVLAPDGLRPPPQLGPGL